MSWSLGAGLEDRVALVTGAAGGIGAATARALSTAGMRIAAVDLDREGAAALVDELDGGGGRHRAIGCDLTDAAATRALVARVTDELGALYLLVNAAAVLIREPLDDVSDATFGRQVDANLRAPLLLCTDAAATMRAAGGGGRIVNFTSQSWWTGGYGSAGVYAATKAAVVALTRNLARTYASDGILVNAVAPGAVETRMFSEDLSAEARAEFLAQVPLGRIAAPEEVASVVVFLASDHASYVTGATLNVSGGQLIY